LVNFKQSPLFYVNQTLYRYKLSSLRRQELDFNEPYYLRVGANLTTLCRFPFI